MTGNNQIIPKGKERFLENSLLGFQHVCAMFGATVLAPLLMGFNPNTAILFSGVGTLIFYFIVGGKIPSYLGSSFAFISVVIAATGYSGVGENLAISVALGGIIIAGLFYSLIGVIVHFMGSKFIDILFPKVVTGSVIVIIGLNLSKVAINQIGTNIYGILTAMLTLLLVASFAVYARGYLKRIPILVGGVIGYGVYYYLGNICGLIDAIDYTKLINASWFGMPQFYSPVFEIKAISLIAPVALLLVIENLGHVKAIGGMLKKDLSPYLGRAFIADGIATMISGARGGTGVTTYAENIGVMKITNNFSSITMLYAAIIAILLGFSPKFGQLILTVPTPVLGGLSLIMFGIISATGISVWQNDQESSGKIDFTDTKTLITVGVSLVMGAGDFTINMGQFSMGGIMTATIASVCLYHFLNYLDCLKK